MTTTAANTASIVATTADAMRLEEITGARRFLWTSWIASAVFLALLPVVPGPDGLERVAAISVIACSLIGLACTPLLQPHRYRPGVIGLVAVFGVVPAAFATIIAGAFSIVVCFLPLAVYVLGRAESTVAAVAIYLAVAFGHFVLSLLICFAVVADPGLYSIAAAPITEQLVAAVCAQGVLLGVFILARHGRRASVTSIEELRRATRLASQRQAMLNELRQDLAHALGIGGPGRHTDRELAGYQLGVVIGRGAMSEVYEANHVDTGAVAAVKLLHRDLMADPEHVARFVREVDATRRLGSAHVVQILGASEPTDPIPFLVMERLHGETLAELLRRRERLEGPELVELVDQVSSALGAAAGEGIVHRDLKPQNLMLASLDERRIWKVLDFGVAALTAHAGSLTEGQVVGTPSYMSPEQAQGARVDGRTDVYGLAAVCYRCLTGRSPFSARDTPALLYKVVHEMPIDPRQLGRVHDEIAAVLAIGMAKDLRDRFESSEELAAALALALRGRLSGALATRAAALLARHPWRHPL